MPQAHRVCKVYNRQSKSWQVSAYHNGRTYHIGHYADHHEAVTTARNVSRMLGYPQTAHD